MTLILTFRVKPIAILVFGLVTSVLATTAMLFLAEHSFTVLNILIGTLGFATSSNYATTLLWVEEHIELTGWISSLFAASIAIGTQVRFLSPSLLWLSDCCIAIHFQRYAQF